MDISDKEGMAADIFICNGDQNIVVFENYEDFPCICLYNPGIKKVSAVYEMKGNPLFCVSFNQKYLISIESQFM